MAEKLKSKLTNTLTEIKKRSWASHSLSQNVQPMVYRKQDWCQRKESTVDKGRGPDEKLRQRSWHYEAEMKRNNWCTVGEDRFISQ